MIIELHVRDFAIIDDVRVELAPGLNVLTGETGAGKSIMVDAVGLLLGDRADTTMVRAGADRAVIQGLFAVAPERMGPVVAPYGVEPAADLIVDREVHAAGRSVARLNGHVVPVKALAEVARVLVDLHGQSETAALKREVEHIDLLDRYAGLLPARDELAQHVERLAAVRAARAKLLSNAAEAARRHDMLTYQVGEISAARLQPDEEAVLLAERNLLANAEHIALLADQVYCALHGADDQAAGVDLIEAAASGLGELARIDAALEPVGEAVAGAVFALTDAARAVRDYRDAVQASPERLAEVEDRLALISELKRKYGASLPEVLDYERQAARELAAMEHGDQRASALEAEEQQLLVTIGEMAAALSSQRAAAGLRLATAVAAELEALGMAGGVFQVDQTRVADAAGAPIGDERYAFDRTGVDRVRYLVALNPGEPPRPLARVASGGETARLMLALKALLGGADAVPVLIFDEIDAGIGGRIGGVVGRKLWALSRQHQVLCVTHLPQVAAYADAHLMIRKAVRDGRTVTAVEALSDAERAGELMHMLGTAHAPGRKSAERLLAEAAAWKRPVDRRDSPGDVGLNSVVLRAEPDAGHGSR